MPDASHLPQDRLIQAADKGPICLIANPRSGRNSRDKEALGLARDALDAEVCPFSDPTQLDAAIARALDRGPRMIVAAGGDGTAMAVASRLVGTGVPMGVLPMGTFNYFARGMGLSEVPSEAAEQLLGGRVADRTIGSVNGQVFLNNASAGIYPSILRERETVYRRWGRRRIMAHWSVVKTFLRFRKPMRVRLTINGEDRELRTPLVFVGRSAFQLERFGLAGTEAVRDGSFAVFVMRAQSRTELFHRTARLAAGIVEEGVDYDFFSGERLRLDLRRRKRMLLAYDGEKRKMAGPLDFRMTDEPLRLVIPRERPE